jgi:vitamin B12 transporter
MMRFTLAIFALFHISILKAENASEVLPEVTVTAKLSTQQLIHNQETFEEADLTVAHERSITEVLEGRTGVNVIKLGGYGLPQSLQIRGAGGLGLITLDDIPLFQQQPGLYNFDALPVEALQKAEVERGPGSIQHPFQALGGSIRLYTQDREETGARLSVEGGSFGILRETAQGSLSGDLGRITVTVNRGDAFDGNHFADSRANPERDRFRFTQGILRFSSDLSKRLTWQGSMLFRHSSGDIDSLGLDKNNRLGFIDSNRSFSETETWLAQSSFNAKITSAWQSRLQLGFTQLTNFSSVFPLQNNLTNRMYLANFTNQHMLLKEDQANKLWQLNWGGQIRQEEGSSAPIGISEHRTLGAGFIETQGHYKNFSGELGVRVEQLDTFGDHALFKSAAAWRITPDLTLRASGGSGYRLPSYTELLSLLFGNPDLRPERSSSGSLGVEWFPAKGLKLVADGYYHRYDDLITQVYDPRQGPITANVPDSEVVGVEFDIQYAWTDFLDSGISYTHGDYRNLESGLDVPLRPAHTARFWAQQKFKTLPITVWAEMIGRSSSWNDFANTIANNESIQLNASIRYALSRQVEFYLRGENLTDNRTPYFYSINRPGIAFYGGIKLAF